MLIAYLYYGAREKKVNKYLRYLSMIQALGQLSGLDQLVEGSLVVRQPLSHLLLLFRLHTLVQQRDAAVVCQLELHVPCPALLGSQNCLPTSKSKVITNTEWTVKHNFSKPGSFFPVFTVQNLWKWKILFVND